MVSSAPETFQVTSGRLSLAIQSEPGGRVASLSLGGRELLVGPEVNPQNWGATYWTSPQLDWGWPPVTAVDSAPYEVVRARGSEELVLRSPIAAIETWRFRIEKHFRRAPAACVDTEYRILSESTEPFRMASWEISRVAPGGLTFFPRGTALLTPIPPHAALHLELEAGAYFYDHSRFELGQSLKVHADGSEGFLAHLAGDLLILKLFADSPAARQAPGEGEVEIFANLDGRYVEIEVQGPYEEVPPGGSTSFVVRTHVAKVPPGLAGDRPRLLEWTRELAAKLW